MCHYLRKSKGDIMKLNSKISKVIQYMISSGLFTRYLLHSILATFILPYRHFSACSLAALFSVCTIAVSSYFLLADSFFVVYPDAKHVHMPLSRISCHQA